MVLTYGDTVVPDDWIVDEKVPPGFSRVYYIQGGDTIYTDDSCSKRLCVGRAYIFPSVVTFKVEHNPNNPLVCTYLHIDWMPMIVSSLIELDLRQDACLYHMMQTLRYAVVARHDQVVEAVAEAFEAYLKEKSILTVPLFRVSAALAYIDEHIHTNMTIEQLSNVTGYHQQYFIRIFTRSIGVSPHQYIINKRLKLSIKLLNSGLSVSNVAEQVGYSDVQAFSRAFKNKFGISPSKFHNFLSGH